ncbi:phospholipid-translocating P-type ATPase [Gymnopus androsaceus JB14]|uniref:Phospholipid-transporting ATPase n=1 Tax=Gymnopus androsaceus JB14 TaxID=1447944 RepID=A0A6A4IFN4_9AGAR|nr:phospholipid-translocating P-type ATPase [Gymnopus androsaceus JB14]
MAPIQRNRFAEIYAKFAALIEPGPRRTVFVNEDLPQEYWDVKGKNIKPEHVYTTNQVITSKYTIITFLPRNLLEQFRRVANVFFLGIAILQFFSKFSTISPGLVILPLLIVCGITAAKDAYEDVKRHQSDRRVNHTAVRVLHGSEWNNPNPMQPKSRTFVRGIIPKRLRPQNAKPNAPDIEKAVGVGSGSDTSPDEPSTFPEDVEFDEDIPEHERRFSFHSHHVKRPHWKRVIWEDVRVGDVVKILEGESFPSDILICSTSEDENVAFVETKNLDGETNLKSRTAVSALTGMRTAADCCKKEHAFSIDLDRPDNNMFRLNSAVNIPHGSQSHVSADITNTLLRGTVLRNTDWVIGVVLFTGEDTKIVQNSGGTPSKRSKVERQMNPQVFLNLILLAMMAVACAIVDSVLEKKYYPRGAPWLFDDDSSDDNPSINGLVTWAFALITLYISVEAVRSIQAAFIYFDSEMVYDKTGQATLARSWNLSDDLGQIQYIFSDKTGTLTQNSMVFQQCSIGGQMYSGDPEDETILHPNRDSSSTGTPDIPSKETAAATGKQPFFHSAKLSTDLSAALHSDTNSPNAAHARAMNGFFSVLALCHTVLTSVDPETGKIEYKAQSPDEAALVKAAADVGYVFRGREKEILYLQTPLTNEKGSDTVDKKDTYEKYELLNILEFNSTRKRMSVVLRKLDGDDRRVFLLMKGADNVVFERLKEGVDQALKDQTEMHLSEFANGGLRTLTLAYKIIPEQEYDAWRERYHEATVALDDREEKIDAVSDELEQNVRLLGATGIEDKLQDGVAETIADLKRAGIKIWVATGDKLETAIAIGHSTNLIARDSNIIVIRGGHENSRPVFQQMLGAVQEFFPESGILDDEGGVTPGVLHRQSSSHSRDLQRPIPLQRVQTGISSIVGSDNGDRPGGFVLVIDGTALSYVLGDETNKNLLLRLAMLCEGVICCRVSPLQKALVVKLVKDGLGVMTLAIGDGANDVSMIQAADVGVGISGEEGMQAVNSSDYAIAQFRFLKRLLLVHGHWSYARNSNMILNFFYKNIVCIGVLWWFQIYNAWSSAYAFEYTYLLFWNAFWTIAPVIAIGIFDRIIDSHVLMALPELYRYGREGHWFGMKWFLLYMLDGIYQSAVIYFFINYTYSSTPTSRSDGYGQYQYEFTTTMVFAAVIIANLFNGLNTAFWTAWVFFAVFIGIILIRDIHGKLAMSVAIYNLISPGWFYTPVFGNDILLFHSAYFWLCLPLTVCLGLAPRYLLKAYKFIFAPDDIDIMRWANKVDPNRDYASEAYLHSGLEMLKRKPSRAISEREREVSVRSGSNVSLSASRTNISTPLPGPQQSTVSLSASRTDMATGSALEEGGPAMRRMQSNLSMRRIQSNSNSGGAAVTPTAKTPSRRSKVLSISKSLIKRKTIPHSEPTP